MSTKRNYLIRNVFASSIFLVFFLLQLFMLVKVDFEKNIFTTSPLYEGGMNFLDSIKLFVGSFYWLSMVLVMFFLKNVVSILKKSKVKEK